MGRFTPAIRSVYGENEPTAGDYLARGVAGGIQGILDETDRRRKERETDRAEENNLTMHGYTPAPTLAPGQPPMAPARMMPGAPGGNGGNPNGANGIGQAIGWHLGQSPVVDNSGYNTARTRTGQTFRAPGAAMQAASAASAALAGKRAESDIDVTEYGRKEAIREGTESRLIPLRNQNPSRISFDQRKELANIAAGARAAATAATSNRGNNTTQLQAVTQYQASLDRKVSELRSLIKDAQDKYRDDDAAEYRKLLTDAMDSADENREALKRLSGGGGRPPLNHRPAPRGPQPSGRPAPAAPTRHQSPFASRRPIVVPAPVKP